MESQESATFHSYAVAVVLSERWIFMSPEQAKTAFPAVYDDKLLYDCAGDVNLAAEATAAYAKNEVVSDYKRLLEYLTPDGARNISIPNARKILVSLLRDVSVVREFIDRYFPEIREIGFDKSLNKAQETVLTSLASFLQYDFRNGITINKADVNATWELLKPQDTNPAAGSPKRDLV